MITSSHMLHSQVGFLHTRDYRGMLRIIIQQIPVKNLLSIAHKCLLFYPIKLQKHLVLLFVNFQEEVFQISLLHFTMQIVPAFYILQSKSVFQFILMIDSSLWNRAKEQIDRIKIQKPTIVKNPQTLTVNKRSIDDVFMNSKKLMNQLMPTIKQIKVTKSMVPQSVKLLDAYSQKLGFLPMGQIYAGSGNKYIGRIQDQTQKGQIYFKQFPTINQEYIDSPDLYQNLTFKANRAISKWNQFVKSETQLADFLKRIESQQGRNKMIFQIAKTSSKGTDQLRILSTLYFYYVDQKSPNSNILLLSDKNKTDLIQILKDNGKINDVHARAIDQIKDGRSDLVNYLKKYHQYKKSTIQMSLRQQDFTQFTRMLDSQLAYVPDQMMAQPMRKNSQWYQVYKHSQGEWNSKIIVKQWNPMATWFKAVNYMRTS